MRQIWITGTGRPEVLVVKEAPDPDVRPGEARVRVQASGINFADLLARVGLYPDAPKPPRGRRKKRGFSGRAAHFRFADNSDSVTCTPTYPPFAGALDAATLMDILRSSVIDRLTREFEEEEEEEGLGTYCLRS